MKLKITIMIASLLMLLTEATAPCQAADKRQSHTTVTRTYNNDWQANIVSKHPNSSHFYWTPITVTTAKTVKSNLPARSRSPYRNRKPVVLAWNAYPANNKQTSSKLNSETTNLQCTPTLTYGSTNASLYGSSNLNSQLSNKQVRARVYLKVEK